MRVISGRFKGLSLPAARSTTRPTTDRTKEAIFSRLDARGVLVDARVLDLFAGTGALGVEALSRGARSVVAVESSPSAAADLRRVFSSLASHGQWQAQLSATAVKQHAEAFARSYSGPTFDVVFADPPYDVSTEDCERLMQTLADRRLIGDASMIVFERSSRSSQLRAPRGWHIGDTRRYGESVVWYVQADDSHLASDDPDDAVARAV